MAFGAGIPNPKASVAVKGQREAISIVPGSDEFITQPSGTVNVPDWMAMGFWCTWMPNTAARPRQETSDLSLTPCIGFVS